MIEIKNQNSEVVAVLKMQDPYVKGLYKSWGH